ncbi:MAG: DUF692 family multinuclear iron-containing protein [Cyanobium sp.]
MAVRIGTNLEEISSAFVETILPCVDLVEVVPDTLARKGESEEALIPKETLDCLVALAQQVTITLHGVGLSLGTARGWNPTYFRLLDQLLDVVPVAWHSEHLGFTHVDGQFTGSMLSLPRTQEALDLVVERICRIRERYPLPFLLENIVNLLPDPPAEMTEALFLNQITRQSGCELLLDIYNLRCNAHNQAYNIADFLEHLDLGRVREIHIAGGVERAGLMLDVHAKRSQAETKNLLAKVLPRCPNVEAVVYEIMSQSVPSLGHPAWTDELSELRELALS